MTLNIHIAKVAIDSGHDVFDLRMLPQDTKFDRSV